MAIEILLLMELFRFHLVFEIIINSAFYLKIVNSTFYLKIV